MGNLLGGPPAVATVAAMDFVKKTLQGACPHNGDQGGGRRRVGARKERSMGHHYRLASKMGAVAARHMPKVIPLPGRPERLRQAGLVDEISGGSARIIHHVAPPCLMRTCAVRLGLHSSSFKIDRCNVANASELSVAVNARPPFFPPNLAPTKQPTKWSSFRKPTAPLPPGPSKPCNQKAPSSTS